MTQTHNGSGLPLSQSVTSIIAYYITSYPRKSPTKQRNPPGERL